jgi:hypothetical protein
LTWLVDQVSNHTARPTRAQVQQIGIFEQQTRDALARFEALNHGGLRQLNEKLQAAGLSSIQ